MAEGETPFDESVGVELAVLHSSQRRNFTHTPDTLISFAKLVGKDAILPGSGWL